MNDNNLIKRGVGRPKGVPNKVGTELKQTIKEFIDSNQNEFEERFSKLNDKDYCQIYLKMMEFCVPKLQSTKFEDTSINKHFQPIIVQIKE